MMRSMVASAAALIRSAAVWSVCAVVVAGGGCAGRAPRPAMPGPAGPGIAAPEGLDTTVERIVDGDTLVVAGRHRVRLIGVDTPETKDPRRPVECFGEEAAAFLRSLLPRGGGVRLVGDVEQHDRYRRTLAYVYRLSDGLFVNAALLRHGYAQPLTIPPNLAHADEFLALSREAREAGRGLWKACEGVH